MKLRPGFFFQLPETAGRFFERPGKVRAGRFWPPRRPEATRANFLCAISVSDDSKRTVAGKRVAKERVFTQSFSGRERLRHPRRTSQNGPTKHWKMFGRRAE